MREKYLICTDLDRTLIPNGADSESPVAESLFGALAERADVTLAYASGRHRGLVEKAMMQYQLPQPDFVIGDVGTTMYRVDPVHGWRRDEAWERSIAGDWRGLNRDELASLLWDLPGLSLQEPSKQNRFKLSYYVDDRVDTALLLGAAAGRLEDAKVKARLVSSRDDISGQGLLDVLPLQASKRHAIEALMEMEGFSLEQTVFCGDSGNDLEVLVSRIPAVLVANARREVKQRASLLAEKKGCTGQLYIARGGFLDMNGNYRGGMLEGIAHFHPSIGAWLQSRTQQ